MPGSGGGGEGGGPHAREDAAERAASHLRHVHGDDTLAYTITYINTLTNMNLLRDTVGMAPRPSENGHVHIHIT